MDDFYFTKFFNRTKKGKYMNTYQVTRIEEPDFGCEGLMDGQQVIDKVTLIDEKGNLLYIEAADMYLYDKGIDVGDKVIIQDNLLVKAGQE